MPIIGAVLAVIGALTSVEVLSIGLLTVFIGAIWALVGMPAVPPWALSPWTAWAYTLAGCGVALLFDATGLPPEGLAWLSIFAAVVVYKDLVERGVRKRFWWVAGTVLLGPFVYIPYVYARRKPRTHGPTSPMVSSSQPSPTYQPVAAPPSRQGGTGRGILIGLGGVLAVILLIGACASVVEFEEPSQQPAGSIGGDVAAIGDPQTLTTAYFDPNNGEEGTLRIRATLLGTKNNAKPNARDAEFTFPRSETRGKRWVRLQFKIENRGRFVMESQDPAITVLDTQGEQYEADINPAFTPDLYRSDFQPGDTQVGYVGVLVPKRAALDKVQMEIVGEQVEWGVV